MSNRILEVNDDDGDLDLINDVNKLELCMENVEQPDEDDIEAFDLHGVLRLFSEQISVAPVTAQNVMNLNQINVCILKQMEIMIKRRLEQLDALEQKASLNLVRASSNLKDRVKEKTEGAYTQCVMPFFKTVDGAYTHEPNIYRVISERSGFLPVLNYFKTSVVWNSLNCKRLVSIVQRCWRNKILEKQEEKVKRVLRQEPDQRKLLKASQELQNAMIHNVQADELNWWHVSAEMSDSGAIVFMPSECMMQWKYVSNPKINNGRWAKNELKKLLAIADERNYQNWDEIAQEVGNGRTPLQCCMKCMKHLAIPRVQMQPEMGRQRLLTLFYESSNWARPRVRLAYYFYETCHRQMNLLISRMTSVEAKNEFTFRKGMKGRWMSLKKKKLDANFSIEDDNFLIDSRSKGWDWPMIQMNLPGKSVASIQERHKHLVAAGKRALRVLERERNDSPLVPSNPTDVSSILNLLFVDKDKPDCSRYGVNLGMKKGSVATSQLCKHLKASTNLFGPRFPVPRTLEKQKSMACTMSAVMQTLSVDYHLNALIDKIKSLRLEGPERCLEYLNAVPLEHLPQLKGECLLPPNKLTLTGFRALSLSRGLLLAQTSLPIQHQSTKMDMSIAAKDRLTVEQATEKLKNRIFSLFFISSCFAKISAPVNCEAFTSTTKKTGNLKRKRESQRALRQRLKAMNSKRWRSTLEEDVLQQT